MVKVKLDNGDTYKVNEKKFNDIRFLKVVAKAQTGDLTASLDMIGKLLGEDQEEKLYKSIEVIEDGEPYVDAEKAMNLIAEIIEKINLDGENTGKNF